MAVTCTETFDSRAFDDGGFTFKFIVIGTSNDDQIRAAVNGEAPESFRGLPRGPVSANPVGHNVWRAEVPYRDGVLKTADVAAGQDPGQQGEFQGGGNMPSGVSGATPLSRDFSFSTGGGTTRIYAALEHIKSHGRRVVGGLQEEDAPDHHGLINVTKDGVEGVDIVSPSVEFTISQKMQVMTWGYFKRLLATTARTNDKTWGPFAQDEVLMLGADGSYKGSNTEPPWNLSVRFGFSPTNEELLSYGRCEIPPGEKHGWYYHWVEFEESKDEKAPARVRRPKAVHIERVYDRENFDLLKLIG